ncbi:serine hydrolase [Gordonia sp. SID5947]|uniref:serine hydrolase domain-containing protein n=1 Tax=Gordonia sp. SID5947 TaxID=2690315 RepID=UPI00136DF6DD|nr:serine hydrolase domain-containing protein [Gordonia sp. SID5947]MYR08894.1 serine hydrolase [Gordonia sp. SID5947]
MGPRSIDSRNVESAVRTAIDAAVTGSPRVPGVVAGVTTDKATLTLAAAGVRAIDGTDPMTTDTVFAMFSATKAITATVALQLVERGLLDLDAPAKEYAPRLRDIQVLDGFADDGSLRLRPPASDVTMRQLLTHTAGFGYDFFNQDYRRLTRDHGVPAVISATIESISTPLLFDPGTRWEYGSSMDWAGRVIEGVTGHRLGDVMSEHLFSPLGMSDTSFDLTDDLARRRAVLHHRAPDDSLSPNHKWKMPDDPEVQMGGQGLYSTVRDYIAFIRMWLNDGLSDSGEQILRPETIVEAGRNQIGDLTVTKLPGVIPALSHDVDFFPGVPKSWGLSFLINDEDAPTGRPAGSLSWAGLANLYYWIDRRTKIGGFWATQIFPFVDPTAYDAYLDFETVVYRAID